MTCSICLENIKQKYTLQCGHVFHKTCIKDWENHKQTCPLCRQPIKLKISIVQQLIQDQIYADEKLARWFMQKELQMYRKYLYEKRRKEERKLPSKEQIRLLLIRATAQVKAHNTSFYKCECCRKRCRSRIGLHSHLRAHQRRGELVL